ncbi:MAG: NADH:ubiquinone oxidoreductase [candidate division Zixibacteria bacterium]|nr:NADH:ubiquinone oxidoreductase [candidate division Zixibacteria bacterium]
MSYLGIDFQELRLAIFDFTGCEGCELQLANKEETLVDFLRLIKIMSFREISTAASDEYDIALIEGAISRADEVERLRAIRARAKVLVALGSCACFGGVNRLKNAHDLHDANREVYGNEPKETLPVRAIKEVVPVDLEIPGCPVSKHEVERIIQHLIVDIPFHFPAYPVCLECKQRYTICRFDHGELCLGPISMGGCTAPCPAGGLGCWGCRGPAKDANLSEFLGIAKEKGFSRREIDERMSFFGAFEVTK